MLYYSASARQLMCPGLQISDDLPDLLFAEMSAPGWHDRAQRTVRLDRFADFDAPVEIGRVDLPIMAIAEISRRRVKEIRPVGAPLARLAVAGRTFVLKQGMAGTELYRILHQAVRHLSRRIVDRLFAAPVNKQRCHDGKSKKKSPDFC